MNIWVRAWAIFQANFAIVAVIAAALVAVDGYKVMADARFGALTVLPIILQAAVLVAFHHHALYGAPAGFGRMFGKNPAFGRFLWRYMLCALFFFVPALIWAVVAGSQAGVYIIILCVLALYGLLLSKYGTIFPAVVCGGDASWARAAHRGRRTSRKVLARLLVGPFLGSAALMILVAILIGAGVPSDPVTEMGEIDILGAAISFVITAAMNVPMAVGVLALSDAYIEVEGAPEAA